MTKQLYWSRKIHSSSQPVSLLKPLSIAARIITAMRRDEVVEDTQNGGRLIDNDEARASASNDDWRHQ